MIRIFEMNLLFYRLSWLWCPASNSFCWAVQVLPPLGLWLPQPDKHNLIKFLIFWTYSLIEIIGVSELHGLHILNNPFLKVNVTVANVLVELFKWCFHVDLGPRMKLWRFLKHWKKHFPLASLGCLSSFGYRHSHQGFRITFSHYTPWF